MATIWKRKRAKRDVWIVDFADAAGVRHRMTAPTRDKAEGLLADKIKESREPQKLTGDPDTTIGQYATMWFKRLETSGIKPRTIQSYRQLYTNHIEAPLGDVRIRDLRRLHVKALLQAKREQIIPPKKAKAATGDQVEASAQPQQPAEPRTLSKNTVRLIRACLSAMLSEALDDEMIKYNPAALPSRRRGRKGNGTLSAGERQKAIRPFAEAELGAILRAASTDGDFGVLFLLLARTGMRPGEAIALQWPDLDFTNRKILVERAFSAGELGTTKTDSVRTVDMSLELASALASLFKRREAQALRLGWGDVPDLVFVNSAGKPLDESRGRKRFARAMRVAKVSGHRLYDLRHTFATSLLAMNVPITFVSAQLGHSKPSTTLQHYAHWLPQADAGFVDRLDTAGSAWHQSGASLDSGAESSTLADEKPATSLENFGAPLRTRTADPLIKSQLLYQLS